MNTKLCIPITANNINQAKDDLKKAEEFADLVELRIDYLQEITEESLLQLIDSAAKPLIFTCRPDSSKGKYNGTEEDRLKLFKMAIARGIAYIDLEYETQWKNEIIENCGHTKVIISHHDFEKTPDYMELLQIYRDINKCNPDYVKIVTMANSINDNFLIFKLLNEKVNLISFCMGIKGEISRILAPKFGSAVSFASLGKNMESAPGQISAQEMIDLYGFYEINEKTKVIGVIGEFAEHSKSKYMHNKFFHSNQLNNVFVPFKVDPGEDLEIFMNYFKKFDFAGAAVTIPHKIEVMKYLNIIDKTAREIGAVNTILNRDGILYGYNTDYIGAIKALKSKTEVTDRRVLVIGAGGAARAIVYGLKQENAQITIINRTLIKAKDLAKEYKCSFENFSCIETMVNIFDIIINTTNVGMYPDVGNSIVSTLPEGKIVMDIVYNPIKTKFVKLAEAADCRVVTGEKMLILQAMAQLKIWTGSEPEYSLMENVFLSMNREN